MPRIANASNNSNRTSIKSCAWLSTKWKIAILVIVLALGMVMFMGGVIYMNYEPCEEGYTGDDCRLCTEGYHKGVNGSCVFGDCGNFGTLGPGKNCICEAPFAGTSCDLCEKGYIGTKCGTCDKGFIKINGKKCIESIFLFLFQF